jgi:hypothetical protein
MAMRMFFGCLVMASMIGIFASCFCSFSFSKMGDSAMVIRIQMPTMTRRKLARKGTRQPQERKSASGILETARKTSVEDSRPMKAPSCGQEP